MLLVLDTLLPNPKFRAICTIYIGEPDSEQSPGKARPDPAVWWSGVGPVTLREPA